MTIDEIKKKSIRVIPGTLVNGEFGGKKKVRAEYLSKWTEHFEGAYGTNNGSVAFVEGGEYYILPFTKKILEDLESEGFKDRSIGVCISGSESPADPTDHKRWMQLKAAQEASFAS